MQNAQVHVHQAPAAVADLDIEYIASLLDAKPSNTSASFATQRKRQRSGQSKPDRPAVYKQHVSDALVSRYNRPVSQPGLKIVRCEACSCSVEAGERAWRIHAAGQKHQRQIVSLRHTGQLGSRVLSVFESVPGDTKPEYQLVVTCADSSHTLKLTSAQAKAYADTQHDDSLSTAFKESTKKFRCQFPQRLFKLRVNAMMNILNLSPSGSYTQRTADQYSPQELSFAFAVVAQKHAEALANSHRELVIMCSTPNQIVCLASLLTEQHHIKRLKMTGQHSRDIKQHPEEVMAVQMLLRALQSQTQLEHAIISIEKEDEAAQPPCWVDMSQRCCHHSCESLSGIVTSIVHHGWWLRYLEIQVPVTDNRDVRSLQDKCKSAASSAHHRRREQLATALLMGTHVRLGASSWLRQIPTHILQDILCLMLPQEPCQVNFACTGRYTQ